MRKDTSSVLIEGIETENDKNCKRDNIIHQEWPQTEGKQEEEAVGGGGKARDIVHKFPLTQDACEWLLKLLAVTFHKVIQVSLTFV